MYVCVTGGTGSAAVFRKIAGPGTAGQFHVANPVRRAYDTRISQVNSGNAAQGGQGVFVPGTTRTVDLSLNFPGTSTPLVPPGATAAVLTAAVFEIQAEGFLTLYPTGGTFAPVINVYWGNVAGSQTSSMTVVKLDASRRFDVRSTMLGTSVSVTFDVLGYYL
jgi:hypothetical protein